MIHLNNIYNIAKDLIDCKNENEAINVEYVRGICELIADIESCDDLEHYEKSIQVAKKLGLSELQASKLYKVYEN